MALTVLAAQEHLEHALGGPLVGIPNRRVIDEAGRKLYALNSWNFLKRPSTTVTLTTSQAYAALPSDFGEIISIHYAASTLNDVQETTLTEIAELRARSVPCIGLYVAVGYAVDANGVPVARLEVYPTPTASDTLTLFYRAGWVDLANSDQTFIPVPPWMESLFVQMVRATAWGYQDDSMGARVTSVMNSPEWYAAVRYDQATQWDHGQRTGGWLEENSEPTYLTEAALPPS